MTPDRLPLLMFGLMGLVIVAVVGMATGSWAWFAVALLVHLVASFFVIRGSIGSARTGTDSDDSSERLARAGRHAAGSGRPTLEDELEALKHEPPSHPARR